MSKADAVNPVGTITSFNEDPQIPFLEFKDVTFTSLRICFMWNSKAESSQSFPMFFPIFRTFGSVRGRYPHRPELPVLTGLSFSLRKGQSIALVGPSGSGKCAGGARGP